MIHYTQREIDQAMNVLREVGYVKFLKEEETNRRGGWTKGKPRSPETKKKISDTLRGRKLSDETKKRMSEAQKTRDIRVILKMMEEEILRIRKAAKGDWDGANARYVSRPDHEYIGAPVRG